MKKQCGFTILELMITLAIMGVIIAVAFPQFSGIKKDRALDAQAKNIEGFIKYVQQEAMDQNKAMTLSFPVGGTSLIVNDGTSNIREFPLKNGIYIDAYSDNNILVNKTGFLLSSKILIMKNTDNKSIRLSINKGGDVTLVWQ